MKEFALIFRLSNINDFKPTPEQIQERMTWLKSIADEGKLANAGNTLLPFAGSAKTVRGRKLATDGPFTEIKEFVVGYVIVRAETIEEAVEMAERNPIFKLDGSVEVRELLQKN